MSEDERIKLLGYSEHGMTLRRHRSEQARRPPRGWGGGQLGADHGEAVRRKLGPEAPRSAGSAPDQAAAPSGRLGARGLGLGARADRDRQPPRTRQARAPRSRPGGPARRHRAARRRAPRRDATRAHRAGRRSGSDRRGRGGDRGRRWRACHQGDRARRELRRVDDPRRGREPRRARDLDPVAVVLARRLATDPELAAARVLAHGGDRPPPRSS